MLKKKQVRIPTILALFILLLSMGAGVYLVEKFPPFSGQATSGDIIPQDVRVSKIGNSSFVVSWITLKKTPGFVRYGVDAKLGKTAYDSRDKGGIPQEHKVHYIKIAVTKPSDKINYEISSGGKTFPQESVALGPDLIEMPQVLPIYGQLETQEGGETQGAIIYLTLKGAALWSSFLTGSKSWVIPLAGIRSKNLQSFYCQIKNCSKQKGVKIEIYAEEGNSQVATSLAQARPLFKPIILGKNYSSLSPPPSALPSKVYGEKTSKKDFEVKVLNPKQGAALIFSKPLIRGLGVPGKEVIINLESQKMQRGKIKVREDGSWFWTPKNPLAPGKHQLSIETYDSFGNKVIIKRGFLILPSGERVLAGSTPSASLTPTATPTTVPTFTPTPKIVSLTPTPTLPPSGFSLPSLLLFGSGFSLLLLGLTFF